MKVYSGNKSYIFISYAHADAKMVIQIIKKMQNTGFRLWYDEGIEAGTEWPQNIAEHIANASCVMVFMSSNSSESHNCRNEINLASELRKEMFIVHLEDFELSLGLRLQLNLSQAIYKTRFLNDDDFYTELINAKIIQPYREHENTDIKTVTTELNCEKTDIKEGLYKIYNAHSGLLLNVYAGVDRDGTSVTLWEEDNSRDQEFYICSDNKGQYEIKYAASSKERVIDVNRGQSIENAIERGDMIDIWSPNDPSAQIFNIITCEQGECMFELAKKPGYVVSPLSKNSSEINGARLILDLNMAEKYQKWYLKLVK